MKRILESSKPYHGRRPPSDKPKPGSSLDPQIEAKIEQIVKRISLAHDVHDLHSAGNARPPLTGPNISCESTFNRMTDLFLRLDRMRHNLDNATYRLTGRSQIISSSTSPNGPINNEQPAPSNFFDRINSMIDILYATLNDMDHNLEILSVLVQADTPDGAQAGMVKTRLS